MSNTRCCVVGCKSSYYNISKEVSLFRVKLRWVEFIQSNPLLKSKSPSQIKNKRICAKHFENNCFYSSRKDRLTDTAEPTKHLGPTSELELVSEEVDEVTSASNLVSNSPVVIDPSTVVSDSPVVIDPSTVVSDSPVVIDPSTVVSDSPVDVNGNYCSLDHDYGKNSSYLSSAHVQTGPGNPAAHLEMDVLVSPAVDCPLVDSEVKIAAEDGVWIDVESQPSLVTPASSSTTVLKRERFIRGLPVIPKIPRSQRTPLVTSLLSALLICRNRARRLKKESENKSKIIKEIKKNQEEEVLQTYKEKLNPSFFKILQFNLRNSHRNKHGFRYLREEKVISLGMHQHGPSGYKAFPMIKPSKSTISRMLKKLKFQPGFNPVLLKAMEAEVSKLSEASKEVSVIFDEMALRVNLWYDPNLDQVNGYVDLGNENRKDMLATEVMVCMIRSIYGNWKQPVAFWYTNPKLTGEDFRQLFSESLQAVIGTGLKVRAMVTDALGKNKTAMALLGSTELNPWFFLNEHKIFTIFDVPHLLKSLRNAILEYLLVIRREVVDIQYVKEFITLDMQVQPRLAKKVTLAHLSPSNFEKMRVAPAAQLLSNTIAAGVMTYATLGALPGAAMVTGRFFEKINNLFDSLNGVNLEASDPDSFKVAVTPSSRHMQLWEEMYHEIGEWQFVGSKNLAFPRNWQMTLKAMGNLWVDLQKDKYEDLPVGRINGDCIENFNSRTRMAGGLRKNPSTREYPAAFAATLIKDITTGIKGKNCENDNADTFVSLNTLVRLAEEQPVLNSPSVVQLDIPAEPETEEEDFEISLQENENVFAVPLTSCNEFAARMREKMGAAISASDAAPLVASYMKKFNCTDCSKIMQSSAAFPLHILSTLTSAPQDQQQYPSPSFCKFVKSITDKAHTLLPQNIIQPKIITNLLHKIENDPEVAEFNLCPTHQYYKSVLLQTIAQQAISGVVLVLNQTYKDNKKKKMLEKCVKLQMVSHL